MNILIIRTIQFALLERLLLELRTQFPEAKISVLTNLQQLERVSQLAEVEHVFGIPAMRDYSITNIGLKNILAIRKCKFDRVIVPHMQPGFGGFGNVLLFLPLLRIREWQHCSTDWKLISLKKSSFWVLVGKSVVAAIAFLPAAIMVLVGFLYIKYGNRKQSLPPHKRWYAGFGDL